MLVDQTLANQRMKCIKLNAGIEFLGTILIPQCDDVKTRDSHPVGLQFGPPPETTKQLLFLT